MALTSHGLPIDRVTAAAYVIPTDGPESDGTMDWDATTLVLVQIEAGGRSGIGYSYADSATATLIRDKLAELLIARDAFAINGRRHDLLAAIFRRMLEAKAVDILQADTTRCGGITGFLGAAALCEAFAMPLSSHCAPALHLPLCCVVQPAVHLEYFHDHVRIEQMLFDGALVPEDGHLAPDLSRPGLGLEFKEQDAQCYRI